MIVLLLACASRQPAPLFPTPIHRFGLPPRVDAEPAPTDCPDADVVRGEPAPYAADGVATCDGQLVSPALALELVQDRQDARNTADALGAAYGAWTAERAVCEDVHARDGETITTCARELRGARLAAPAAFAGGVLLGLAAGIMAGVVSP